MYGSDLSDAEWVLIEHHFQPNDHRGAVPTHAKRDLFNAILYVNETKAQWRMPKEFPTENGVCPVQQLAPAQGLGSGTR